MECFGHKNLQDYIRKVPKDILDLVCMTATQKSTLLKNANNSKLNIFKKESKPTFPTTRKVVTTTKPIQMKKITAAVEQIYPTVTSVEHVYVASPSSNHDETTGPLSILEIVLIAVAGVAVITLIIKFIFCHIFNKLHGEVVLTHEANRNSSTTPLTMPTDSNPNGKKKSNIPLSAYWV